MIHHVITALVGHLETVGVQGSVDAVRVVYLSSLYRGRAVFAVFHGQARPSLIVKVEGAPERFGRLRQEWATLTELAARPDLLGRVPEPISLATMGDSLVLAQSALPGTPMNVVLRRRLLPHAAGARRDHHRLQRWHRLLAGSGGGARTTVIEPDHVMERVEQQCAGSAVRSADVESFGRLAARVGPVEVPLTPVHGDLNAANYLLDRGRLNVIDWEGGLTPAPAPTELLVSLIQYARATPGRDRRLLGRRASFEQAFCSDHWLARTTSRTWGREVAGLGLPPEAAPYLLGATLAEIVSVGHRLDPTGARQSWQRPDWRTSLHAYLADRPASRFDASAS